MSSLLKVGLMVLSVAGFSSCREPGRLADFAAGAKQRGEKTAEIFDKVPRVTSNNLESAQQSIYLVDKTGAISAPRSDTFDPFAQELLDVKTVDAIKERIRNASR